MKVNQNISAVISNAHLHRAEDKLTASIQRLSSGYKINSAKDSPSGMAISNKMRAQIEALDRSTENASDGISVIQTADGALTETHSILQRMRELSVQAATDSMTPEDKEACQAEINQLQKEIDRIAKDTEFNSKIILDGSQDTRIYPSIANRLVSNAIRNFQTSDAVTMANYSFMLETAPQQASLTVDNFSSITNGMTVSICGTAIDIPENITADERFEAIREGAENLGIILEKGFGDQVTFTTVGYGSKEALTLDVTDSSNQSLIDQGSLTVSTTLYSYNAAGKLVSTPKTYTSAADLRDNPSIGLDTKITLGKVEDPVVNMIDSDGTMKKISEGFSKTSTYYSDGQKVTITDINGFEMTFKVDPENNQDIKNMNRGGKRYLVSLEMTDLGDMTLQVGAHENQTIDVRIPAVDCESLYIDDINVVRTNGAGRAIEALDKAISQVSAVRSRLGAYQNRLEYAVSSLEGTEENMESAISRIMDTDMAEEMSTYSNMNILDQAAISVLSQANDLPQQILQMLG